MAISSTTARVSYNGDGATTEFNTGFKFLANAHVQVVLRDTDGVETTWTEGTHYTLTGAGETQGTVTVDTSPTDYTPQTGEKLAILRIAPNKQESTLPLGGAFPSTTVEQALDLAAMRDQQLAEKIERALFFPVSDPVGIGAGLPIDTDRAGKFLAFDANGAPVVTAGTADATPHNAFMIELHGAVSASAARATLGVVNPTAGSGIDVTAGEVSLDIDGLTEDATPDRAADFVPTYDASAGAAKKVKLSNLAPGAASDTVAGVIEVADKTEMEAASSTILAVTPGRQQFHPSAAKAWINFNGTGTIAIRASHNVNAITDNGTGNYTVTIETDLSSGNYAGVATAKVNDTTTSDSTITNVGSFAAGSFRIHTNDANGTSADCVFVSAVIFGDI